MSKRLIKMSNSSNLLVSTPYFEKAFLFLILVLLLVEILLMLLFFDTGPLKFSLLLVLEPGLIAKIVFILVLEEEDSGMTTWLLLLDTDESFASVFKVFVLLVIVFDDKDKSEELLTVFLFSFISS